MTKEISYLGFKITDKGLFKTDEKIKAIKESLAPTNVSEVRSFLGLVTFYSKFVPNLATIAAPIYQLTHKNVPFDWNEECQKAFQSLKQELISNRFLTYFIPSSSPMLGRQLPDDNRNMMISRSSGRSGFIYMVNV